ncbi:MAG: coniferyl-alcohol dehydrogenase [Myxococcota bacterium]
MKDILDYAGRTVVVSGCATGMGAAAARTLVDLGAEVHALDVKPVEIAVKQSLAVDLRDRDSIDQAVSRLPAAVDVHFNCAGLPGPPFSTLDTMLVNFVGLRHLTEAVLPRVPRGGAVASITSVAGMGYRKNIDAVNELLATPDFESGRAWCADNPEKANGYLFSKQCIIAYTLRRAAELAPDGIRVNCLSPAPTDTPMMDDFESQIGKDFMVEHFQAPVGRNATPEEMAEPLVFLGSRAARFVSGVNLFVDFGYTAAVDAGLRPALL